MGQNRDQCQLRVQDGNQGGLAADQRRRHVEALLRQQRVQVVARHPAGDLRVPGAGLPEVGIPQGSQLAVDLRLPIRAGRDLRVLLVGGGSAPESGAFIEQHLQSGDVVHHLAGPLRRRTAGVVPDHAAQGAVVMGCRFRPIPRARAPPTERSARPARCRARPHTSPRPGPRRSAGDSTWRSPAPPPRCSTARPGWCRRRGTAPAPRARGTPRQPPRRPAPTGGPPPRSGTCRKFDASVA